MDVLEQMRAVEAAIVARGVDPKDVISVIITNYARPSLLMRWEKLDKYFAGVEGREYDERGTVYREVHDEDNGVVWQANRKAPSTAMTQRQVTIGVTTHAT